MTRALVIALCTVGGFAVGLVYFVLVRRMAAQLASGEMHVGGVIGAAALRLLLFAPGAVVAGLLSILGLGGYLVGFIAARHAVICTVRKGAPK